MASNLLNPDGSIKAEFIKVLEDGECPCKYDLNEYIIQDNRVYKRA